MAKRLREAPAAKPAPDTIQVLPMQLRIGDTFTEDGRQYARQPVRASHSDYISRRMSEGRCRDVVWLLGVRSPGGDGIP